uniref:Cytochrome b5 heme-binding domain-containing protein n=1 Tax=Chromera velia CCMP2878 TaxID=1169474 RepID=A0A0G4I2T4_9ALVE|eukprot:Cvel_1721.t1-p1 / transcript=Cvel_1721.t1 / gene=Cvel_1721 / organism=Chromera_velia_CCMP2878 / gene_product=Cytochrome b5-related protein, putative / transcript_product=Cytochrome b5-related protein, putative / location=Cvel_scaffold62:98412-105091(-) / protein_length=768 / sequence_SO=supercontig / SO=protein_coding / is_pseudo=false
MSPAASRPSGVSDPQKGDSLFESLSDEGPGASVLRYSSGFPAKPAFRGSQFSAEQWLQGRVKDSRIGGLWRVHDRLYDLEKFAQLHPGGRSWIELTRGMDITELFESSHPHLEKAQAVMRQFEYIPSERGGAKGDGRSLPPRQSPLTFQRDSFYDDLRKGVSGQLRKMDVERVKARSKLVSDVCLVLFLSSCWMAGYWRSLPMAVVGGFLLSCLATIAHNFFHQGDNWRMFCFDLLGASSFDFRISHVMSHHMYTNSSLDFEITMVEPSLHTLPAMPRPDWFRDVEQSVKWLPVEVKHILIQLLYFSVALPNGWISRWIRVKEGACSFQFAQLFPFFLWLWFFLANLASHSSPSFLICLSVCWSSLISFVSMWVSGSVVFMAVAMYAGQHHNSECWHEGDGEIVFTEGDGRENLKEGERVSRGPPSPTDFGIFQMAACRDTAEISFARGGVLQGEEREAAEGHRGLSPFEWFRLTVALCTFGDHTLHHLFPTIDAALFPALEAEVDRACAKAGIVWGDSAFGSQHPGTGCEKGKGKKGGRGYYGSRQRRPWISSQIQNGQLEMHIEQEGGKKKEETEGNKECMGPRRACQEGREDGAMSPSPVASAVSGIWVGREEDALHVQEVKKEKEKEGVHVAPKDKKEKEDEEEALRKRLGELKEWLVQVIREKEKRRHPLPHVVLIDAEIQKKMIDHLNPQKGHIDATAEEVTGGSHEGGMCSELERFLEEKVFARGVRLPRGRKAIRCRWVLTWKKKGGERVAKARLVVKGF